MMKKHAKSTPRRAGRPSSPTSLHGWRTRKEAALAQTREIELARLQGTSLEAEQTARAWEADSRRLLAALLAVPSRIRAQLPHLSAHDAQVIDREVRAALTELSNWAARLEAE
jgi:phage terminase Nu1 subunit (DNA packaging protein)